ncbi:MAG: hypothetical protein [Chaetfec virus UA24_144]|nr:MAG: hypothetical protein [Chaetfec virus UA24_144]
MRFETEITLTYLALLVAMLLLWMFLVGLALSTA